MIGKAALVGFTAAATAFTAGVSTGDMFMAILGLEAAQFPLLFHIHGRVRRVETEADVV